MTEKKVKKEIQNIFEGMLASLKAENQKYLEQFENDPAVIQATKALNEKNLFGAYMAFETTHKKVITAFFEANLRSDEMQFLLQNFDFVDSHFDRIFEKKEGHACSADKTSYILRCLYNYYEYDIEIKHNYDQKYTYHLPTKILITQEDILEYFNALFQLYYGRSEQFIDLQEKYKNIPDAS